MTEELQNLVKESDLYMLIIDKKMDAFSTEFNRRTVYALTHKELPIVDFLKTLLDQKEVRQILPRAVVQTYLNLLGQAKSQLMFV